MIEMLEKSLLFIVNYLKEHFLACSGDCDTDMNLYSWLKEKQNGAQER